MNILGVCWISNFTSGISREIFDHDAVLELGKKVSVKMKALLDMVLKSLKP